MNNIILDQDDQWLIDEVKGQLYETYSVSIEDAEKLLEDFKFIERLVEDPIYVHHYEPFVWAKKIMQMNNLELAH